MSGLGYTIRPCFTRSCPNRPIETSSTWVDEMRCKGRDGANGKMDVPPCRMIILGERCGVRYGQWWRMDM